MSSTVDVPQSSLSTISEDEAPKPAYSAVAELKTLLNKSLRVTSTDGRIFLGTFAGTDKLLNIILVNAEEYREAAPEQDAPDGGRYVGQIMIPWRMARKVEAQNVRQRNDNRFLGSRPQDTYESSFYL